MNSREFDKEEWESHRDGLLQEKLDIERLKRSWEELDKHVEISTEKYNLQSKEIEDFLKYHFEGNYIYHKWGISSNNHDLFPSDELLDSFNIIKYDNISIMIIPRITFKKVYIKEVHINLVSNIHLKDNDLCFFFGKEDFNDFRSTGKGLKKFFQYIEENYVIIKKK